MPRRDARIEPRDTMRTTAPKKSAAKKTEPKPKLVAEFNQAPDPDRAEALAKFALQPSVSGAMVLREYTSAVGETDLAALALALSDEIEGVWAGDTKRSEAMLMAQAHALQAIFTNLARRALKQEFMSQWEPYMRIAMKAQSQCRATLETLAAIKNPPMVFARQANINNGGNQQVVNGPAANKGASPAGTPARELQSEPSKLLEGSDVERLDLGAQGAAIGTHPELATVGEVHRAAHDGG